MGLMVSVLVVVAIVAKMLRAIRLLDGRVTLLQEQLEVSHDTLQKVKAGRPAVARPPSGKTPIHGVPLAPAPAAAPRTPAPLTVAESATGEDHLPGEPVAHVIDEAEAEAVWAKMAAEQNRLKKAMGKDFQVRDPRRSAAAIRGKPTVRVLSTQELAKKLERK
jgi:hypothetical protein